MGDTQMWEQNPFYKQSQAKDFEVPTDKSIALQLLEVLNNADISLMKANKARVTGWTNLKILMDWKGDILSDGVRYTKNPHYRVFNTCLRTKEA